MRPLCPLFVLVLFVLGCGKSTAWWTEQLKSADPADRLHAIHALQEKVAEKDTVIPLLNEALKDDNLYVRRDAAKALGKFGDDAKEAVANLLSCLKDKEPSVRKAAGQALKQIAPAAATKAGVK